MICPKCNCEIRVETDACPFCGFVFPSNMKEGGDSVMAEKEQRCPVPRPVNEDAPCPITHMSCSETERKIIGFKKRKARKNHGLDELNSEEKTHFNQEIIILLLFVLIVIGIVQIIILLELR